MTPRGLRRGVALTGRVWCGAGETLDDGVVIVAPDGVVAALGPAGAVDVPEGVLVLGGPGSWVGPGVVDAHVHLSFGSPEDELRGGVVALRDLGAPPGRARGWQSSAAPTVAVVGPLLTAPGGYPSRSWGAGGFAAFVDSPERARAIVADLVLDGVDLVKVALEPGGGALPVPRLADVRAVVEAAHSAGLAVTAHALTLDTVALALDAGVDELAHTPVEVLGLELIGRLVASGTAVVSTIQTFFSGGDGAGAAANARALVDAGVPLVYGSDLGNAGTHVGVDIRELGRLADAGLGPEGALVAATERASRAAGLRGKAGSGRIRVGERAAVVLLDADPLLDVNAWQHPRAVLAGPRLLTHP